MAETIDYDAVSDGLGVAPEVESATKSDTEETIEYAKASEIRAKIALAEELKDKASGKIRRSRTYLSNGR